MQGPPNAGRPPIASGGPLTGNPQIVPQYGMYNNSSVNGPRGPDMPGGLYPAFAPQGFANVPYMQPYGMQPAYGYMPLYGGIPPGGMMQNMQIPPQKVVGGPAGRGTVRPMNPKNVGSASSDVSAVATPSTTASESPASVASPTADAAAHPQTEKSGRAAAVEPARPTNPVATQAVAPSTTPQTVVQPPAPAATAAPAQVANAAPEPSQDAPKPTIGGRISVTTKSHIRYEGILYALDAKEATVALKNVRCFGTEGRTAPSEAHPALDGVFDMIIFRGDDISEVSVIHTVTTISDPAIVNAVRGPRSSTEDKSIPEDRSNKTADGFDFESSNQRFDKRSFEEQLKRLSLNSGDSAELARLIPNAGAGVTTTHIEKAYDKTKSFFDELSCSRSAQIGYGGPKINPSNKETFGEIAGAGRREGRGGRGGNRGHRGRDGGSGYRGDHTRDSRDNNNNRDRDGRDNRDGRERRDYRESRDYRDNRDGQDSRESRDARDDGSRYRNGGRPVDGSRGGGARGSRGGGRPRNDGSDNRGDHADRGDRGGDRGGGRETTWRASRDNESEGWQTAGPSGNRRR